MTDLVAAFRAGALADPAATAVRFLTPVPGDERRADALSRGELDLRVRAVAAVLQREGAVGERVLLALRPGPDLLVGLLACCYAGATAVPCRPGNPDRFVVIGKLADVAIVLCAARDAAGLREQWAEGNGSPAARWLDIGNAGSPDSWVPPRTRDDDLVLLQCPSGSTGSAKAVMVPADAMLTQLTSFRDLVGLRPGFSVVNWAPMDNTLGLELMLMAQLVGAEATWLAAEDFVARPYRWLRAVSDAPGPVLSGGPVFAYDMCVERITPDERAELDLHRWHTTLIGAERIRPSTVERFVETFAPCGLRRSTMMPTYGLTEVMQGIAAGRAGDPAGIVADGHEWVPVGQAAPGARVVVVDPKTCLRCPDGVVGELWIEGPMVCRGYWRDRARTAEVFGAQLADGTGPFLRSGDLGFVLDDKLVVCGRLKEIIIMRGRNYHPEDIESVSRQTLGVTLPAAAFSVDGPEGERLVVVQSVESRDTGAAERVRRAVTAAHGVDVHEVVLVGPDAVPRTATGKIQRVACRQAYLDGRLEILGSAEALPPPAPEDSLPLRDMVAGLAEDLREPVVASEVRRRVAELLNTDDPDELSDETPLMLLGLESVRMIALRHGLEQDFGVSLPIADFVVLSIADVVGVIVKQFA